MDTTSPQPLVPKTAAKLGLALSGGGFRATIFHVGVFRRLAELDLLKDIDAISTVSGGSVTGAHYLMLLKEKIESKNGVVLTATDYCDVVTTMERECREGVARNPRSRLFLNPLWNLKIFCFADPPGERMASIYQRRFYAGVTDRMGVARSRKRPGIRLRNMLIKLGVKNFDIERHNARESGKSDEATQRVPRLILNSSSLNSGMAFRFTATEVGGAKLGFIRFDEATLVRDCKSMLGRARSAADIPDALREYNDLQRGEANGAPPKDATGREAVGGQSPKFLEWFLGTEAIIRGAKRKPESALLIVDVTGTRPVWDGTEDPALFSSSKLQEDISRALLECDFGILRRAKVAAWFLTDPAWEGFTERGGFDKAGHGERFREAIIDIDKELARRLGIDPKRQTPSRPDPDNKLPKFILALYYVRSARAFAWDVDKGLDDLRLVDAVASSANFPPVFTPYHIHKLYDPGTVNFLSLTDGGVHDNTGMQALIDEECTDLIVSDVSGLFHIDKSPAGDRINMMGRIGGILTAHVRNMQLDALHDRVDVSKGVAALTNPPRELGKFKTASSAFFHMLSSPSDAAFAPGNYRRGDPGQNVIKPHPYADLIANFRTDLDVCGSIEIDALIYQGYQLADRFVRKHLKEFPRAFAPQTVPVPDETVHAAKVLMASRLRFGRVAVIYKAPFIVAGLAAAVALIWAIRAYDVSASGAVHGFGAWIGHVVGYVNGKVRWLFPRLWDGIASRERSLWRWLIHGTGPWAVLALIAAAYVICSPRVDRTLGKFLSNRGGGRTGFQRGRLQIARFLTPWRRNLTWFMWLLPLWIAVFGTVMFGFLMVEGWLAKLAASKRSA